MSIFKSIGAFLQKEITGAEKTTAAIGAFIKKEAPDAKAILAEAIAEYKALKALATSAEVESALQGLAVLIADLMAL